MKVLVFVWLLVFCHFHAVASEVAPQALDALSGAATVNAAVYTALEKGADAKYTKSLLADKILLDALSLSAALEKWPCEDKEVRRTVKNTIARLVQIIRQHPEWVEAIPEGELVMLNDPLLGEKLNKRQMIIKLLKETAPPEW